MYLFPETGDSAGLVWPLITLFMSIGLIAQTSALKRIRVYLAFFAAVTSWLLITGFLFKIMADDTAIRLLLKAGERFAYRHYDFVVVLLLVFEQVWTTALAVRGIFELYVQTKQKRKNDER